MSGLITNPTVVQNALKSKKDKPAVNETKKKRKNDPKKENKQQPKQPQSKQDTPKVKNTGSKKKGNPSNASSPSENGSHTSDSTEDLRRALFPDLYESKDASKNGGPKNPTLKNTTPKKSKNNKDPAPAPFSSPDGLFAGSSFHSSPAPSALPKPSFKSKAIESPAQSSSPSGIPQYGAQIPRDAPQFVPPPSIYAAGPPTYPVQPYPPPPPPPAPLSLYYQFPPHNIQSSLPVPNSGDFSLFDQFMLADRQERASSQNGN